MPSSVFEDILMMYAQRFPIPRGPKLLTEVVGEQVMTSSSSKAASGG
jgi:hypothetical protein